VRLRTWLKDQSLTYDAFRQLMNDRGAACSRHAISKWANGVRIPRREDMAVIYAVTDGIVTANDFYDLPDQVMVAVEV